MKLIKGKNANRGFTLSELMVVMALSIMVLTLMVTMLTIFTNKVDQNKIYHGFYDEVAMCRDEIQEFLATVDVKVGDVSAVVKVENNTANGSILSCNGKIVKLYGSEFETNVPAAKKTYLNYIDRIVYDVIPVANGRILKCTFIGSYGKDDTNKGTHKTEFSQSMLFILESAGATFDD